MVESPIIYMVVGGAEVLCMLTSKMDFMTVQQAENEGSTKV